MTYATLLTGPERRRRWSEDDRRRIVAAAFSPGAVVTAVARAHDGKHPVKAARVWL